MEIYGYFKAKGNIMNELVFFLLTEYQSLLLKSYNFETTQYILDIREKLCEWILNNYKNCRDMRLAKKASLIISAKNMRLYLWIRRMLRKDVLGGKMI